MSEEVGVVEEGDDFLPTELPDQKILDKGLHEKAAENAEKAAEEKQIEEPQIAQHLHVIASELNEIAQAGERPLDHINSEDSYVAEAVQSTARLLDDPHLNAERPITYADFQTEVKSDHGYVSTATLSPDHSKVQEKVEILESVLGAGEKHEVASADPRVKIEEASTNMGVTLREVIDQGNVRMSVVKSNPTRMRAPVIR